MSKFSTSFEPSSRELVKFGIACLAVLLGISWAGGHLLLADWAVQRFWPKCVSLLLVIGSAAGAFFLCANALGIGDVDEIVRAVRRRFSRAA